MDLFAQHLTSQVTAALQGGICVIVDPDAAFVPYIDGLTDSAAWSSDHPDVFSVDVDGVGVRFARFDGQWFRLKLALEPFASGDGRPDPPLLVYVPTALPGLTIDVMTEIVRAGERLDWSFEREARACLRQRFTDGVIDGVLAEGRATYDDVVAFLEQDGRKASKLKTIFKGKGDMDILLVWLAEPERDAIVVAKGADEELRKLVAARLGLDVGAAAELSAARALVARYIMAAEFRRDLTGAAPEVLAMIPTPASDAQWDEALALASGFRARFPAAYVVRSDQVAGELHLDQAALDPATLGSIDTFRFEEQRLLEWCAKLLAERRYAEALKIVKQREASFWVAQDIERKAQWELSQRVAELGMRVEAVTKDLPGSGVEPGEWVKRYAAPEGWHAMDEAQRALETSRARMVDDAACEQAVHLTLAAHEALLHQMAERFVAALEASAWTVNGVLHQTRIYPEVVAPRGGPVAYLWVDAMRYEMGVELARLLGGVEDLQLQPAVAALPSITPVGMAALLPGAATDFFVAERGGKLVSVVDGNAVADAKQREKHVKARVPDSVDLMLSQVLLYKKSELKQRVQGKTLVVVRSQEIDELGEKGNDFLARRAMAEVLGDLSRAVRKLANLGIEHFVVTADHGHLFGLRKGDDMKTDAPGGATVEAHRRCWIGRGGSTPPGTVRISAGQLGYRSDLEFVFPRGLGVLKAMGDLAFHHGGTSLQELVVPVLSFRVPPLEDKRSTAFDVRLVEVPPAVTNQLFPVVIEASAKDLFTTESVSLRVVLLSGQVQVGHAGMASVSDFDRRSGVVRVKPGEPVQLVMRLTHVDVDSLKVVVLDPVSAAVLAQSAVLNVNLMR